jgi:predicted RNase H-related nuclease YkuK (DUF458 family)
MKSTRQTPGKKAYKLPFKTYVVQHHHTAYRVYKGRLYFYPVYENGNIDYSRGALLEESPKSFRAGHQIALIWLGIDKKDRIQKIIRQIHYY